MSKSKLETYVKQTNFPWPPSSLSYFKGPLFNGNAYPKGSTHIHYIFTVL